MLSPNGSIEIPEPIVKKLIPNIRSNVPNKNRTRTPAFIGAKLTLKISTIAAIGKTEKTDSFGHMLGEPHGDCFQGGFETIEGTY